MLADLERRAELVKSGVMTSAEGAASVHQSAPLEEHVAAYLDHLRAKGVTKGRVQASRAKLTRLFDRCGFRHYCFYDQSGHLLLTANYEREPHIFHDLIGYCTSAPAVMDFCVFHRDQEERFKRFVEAERRYAKAAIDRYLATYGWK